MPSKSTQRKAYLRPKDETLEKLGDDEAILLVAVTVFCFGLINRPYNPECHMNQPNRATKKSGHDYKKFRKNSILKGKIGRISLRVELPSESATQRMLEEQQRAIDAQQRLADKLFHGGAGRSQSKTSTPTAR